jgi:hypothetical protein
MCNCTVAGIRADYLIERDADGNRLVSIDGEAEDMFIFAFGPPSRMHHRTRETFGSDGRTPGPVQTYHLGFGSTRRTTLQRLSRRE